MVMDVLMSENGPPTLRDEKKPQRLQLLPPLLGCFVAKCSCEIPASRGGSRHGACLRCLHSEPTRGEELRQKAKAIH